MTVWTGPQENHRSSQEHLPLQDWARHLHLGPLYVPESTGRAFHL